MMGLSPVGRCTSMMMMMVMMMTLLVGDTGVLGRRISGDVADDQFRTVALRVAAAVILPVSWFIQGLLATEWRVVSLMAGALVQILPCLTVVPIQTSSTLRGATIETGHGIAVWRRTVTIVFTASPTVST